MENTIEIGKITSAVALKGEVKVYPYSQPERFREIGTVHAGGKSYEIENVRYQANMVILKLKGVDDRNASEALAGTSLFIGEDQLPELPEGEYYIRDLIGMDVYGDDGSHVGVMTGVNQNTPQDIYEIRRDNGRELLVPGVAEFILDIDTKERKIVIKLLEGLLDL